MSKVCVLQTDDRPGLDYLLKTQEVNKKFCHFLEYEYLFIDIGNRFGDLHPATKKIFIVYEFLLKTDCDVLVFLDSDAWIQNFTLLNQIIENLSSNDKKQGYFSRDPYVKKNTFINSGSFIIKINNFTKQMYKDIIDYAMRNRYYHYIWPWDQFYISKYVFENKEHFGIFVPDILNTPKGKILRHNWCKNEKMYSDLSKLLEVKKENNELSLFNEEEFYDSEIFPNVNDSGYEYKD
jgi:hypothetical protein